MGKARAKNRGGHPAGLADRVRSSSTDNAGCRAAPVVRKRSVGWSRKQVSFQMVLVRFAAGVLLLAHRLVHLLYLADDVSEFSMDRSWLVSGAARRPVALGLLAATIAAFALLALGVWGLPGLSGAWPGLMAVGCLLSMALLILFWSPWLIVGLAIDVGLLAIAVTRPDWVERLLS
jgi:hypothetical protein